MTLQYILYDLTVFDPPDDKKTSEEDLCWFMEALTQRNQSYLKARPGTPSLYTSSVRWEAPLQLQGELAEVTTLKKYLGSYANKGEVIRVLDKIQDVLGGEHFCDIGRILQLGSIDCFPLTQKIIVRSKSTRQYELVSIGELRFAYPAYEALSYNFKTGKQEFKQITGFIDKGVKPVSKAHLSNGTDLIATDSHKFWTLDGSKQHGYPDSFRVGERTMGDYVRMFAEREKHGRGWWESRSRILQASRIPALGVTHPTEAEAYLAGIYAAEGFQSGWVTGIAQHKPEVRRKIEQTLAAVNMNFSYDAGGRGATEGSGAQYRLLGGSKKNAAIARLRELGTDSFDKRFPQSFLSADIDTVKHMLAAHADGDGWRPRKDVVYKKSGLKGFETEYSTSSDQLMEQIRLGLLVLGNPAYTYHQLDHQGEGDKPIWRIDEYNEKASKLRNREQRMIKYGCPDLTYATVRGAEPFGEAHVGCIEVEDNHNFFLADGTLAANCDGLACWRVAELRQKGIPARPFMTKRERAGGGTTYHALVLWPPLGPYNYETSEDPSLLLGMYQPQRQADRNEEIRKNQERCDILKRYGLAAVRPSPGRGAIDAGGGSSSLDQAVSELLGTRRRAA